MDRVAHTRQGDRLMGYEFWIGVWAAFTTLFVALCIAAAIVAVRKGKR